jgi:hypothetical protein
MDLGRLDEVLRRLHPDTERACLSACCALSVDLLFGLDAVEVHSAFTAAFAVIEGSATFANAKVLLARLFSVRADVVSGPLEAMCRLNGTAGQVILGVDPSMLYPGATPGRHAILLASCIASGLPMWATGFLDPVRSGRESFPFCGDATPHPPSRPEHRRIE